MARDKEGFTSLWSHYKPKIVSWGEISTQYRSNWPSDFATVNTAAHPLSSQSCLTKASHKKQLPQSAKRLRKSMKLLPEESLRLRACVQLEEGVLTKVLPVTARTCHPPYLFWSWVCIIHRTFWQCHDPFTFPVPNAFSVFSDLWLHYFSVVPGIKSSKRNNQHEKYLSKEEKLSCRHFQLVQ